MYKCSPVYVCFCFSFGSDVFVKKMKLFPKKRVKMKDERWKTFFEKNKKDDCWKKKQVKDEKLFKKKRWKMKNFFQKNMTDGKAKTKRWVMLREKKCQRGRWKKFCLGAWNFDWNLHFSAFRCESNTWTVSKKCHRFWLSFGVNFFFWGGGIDWGKKTEQWDISSYAQIFRRNAFYKKILCGEKTVR